MPSQTLDTSNVYFSSVYGTIYECKIIEFDCKIATLDCGLKIYIVFMASEIKPSKADISKSKNTF